MNANTTIRVLIAAIIGLTVSATSSAMSVRMDNLDSELMAGWKVLFTDTKYRNLDLHYDDGKISPDWPDILDDAGRRYGIAYLVDMENQELLVTQANNGFMNSGIHYIQPNILEQSNRYRWPTLYQAGLTELSQFAFNQKVAEEREFKEQQRQTALEINRRVETTKANLESSYQRKSDELMTLHTERQSKLTSEIQRKEKILAEQRQQLGQIRQENNERSKELARLEVEIAMLKQTLESQGKVLQARAQAIEQKEVTLDQQIQEQTIITKNLRDKYYPSDTRYIPKGEAKSRIDQFLKDNWKYKLKWSDTAVQNEIYSDIVFVNDLHFKQHDLQKDISQIVCTLTRDNDDISFYADIDAGSRIVYMQLHTTTENIRKRIISDCFK